MKKEKEKLSWRTVNYLIRLILLCLVCSNALLLAGNLFNILANEEVVSIVLTVGAGLVLLAAAGIGVALFVLSLQKRIKWDDRLDE